LLDLIQLTTARPAKETAMKLSKADEKSYPKLHRYIKNTLPDVIKVPKIVKALEKNGEIKLRKLKVVLMGLTQPSR
jgi:hypothetical protein